MFYARHRTSTLSSKELWLRFPAYQLVQLFLKLVWAGNHRFRRNRGEQREETVNWVTTPDISAVNAQDEKYQGDCDSHH